MPIAFHVDYFNDPWKDVFSDPLYSQRQMTYNQLYTKPKNAEYGLYYTPMLMIDGEQSVNGRDPASAEAAIRQALAKKPAVGLDVTLDLKGDGLSGTATIKVTSRSARAEKSPLLVCAVLREDGVVTDIPSGENAGKSLVARFPARQTKYEFIELDGKSPATQRFPFVIEPTWNRQEPSAGRVRSGQAHRRGPPGDRPSLAIDLDRRDAGGFDSQARAGSALKSPFPTLKDPGHVVVLPFTQNRRARLGYLDFGRVRRGVSRAVSQAGRDGPGPRVSGRHGVDQLRPPDNGQTPRQGRNAPLLD